MATNTFHMSTSYPKEAERAKKENWPIFIPVGTIEYHSSICPYGCDALVAQGVAEKIGEKIDCMILPTIYYGVSSYAVGGPQTNTINMDVDIFEGYIYNILKSLLKSGFRNINILVFHQTEEILPTAAACVKAGKKLTFEFLEETKGYGWWGDNKNKEFYENLSAEDNPWNWIRVFNDAPKRVGLKGDHAGIYECSNLEYLYPGSIKLERYAEADDWFAETSKAPGDPGAQEYYDKMYGQLFEVCPSCICVKTIDSFANYFCYTFRHSAKFSNFIKIPLISEGSFKHCKKLYRLYQ